MGNILDSGEEEELILESSEPTGDDYPLHQAACQGNVALMQELASAGQAVDGKDPDGNTPLHLAAGFGRVEACDWLLDRGRISINGKGETPSDVARQAGFDALAARLESREKEVARAQESRKFEQERESLFVELDRKSSMLTQLRASERRLRLEVDTLIKERLRLLMDGGNEDDLFRQSLAEALVTELERASALKTTRDALAAELAAAELALFDLEQALGLPLSKDALSVRIKAAARAVQQQQQQQQQQKMGGKAN